MKRMLLAILLASCGGETIDIGSNAASVSAPRPLRCKAAETTALPAPTSSPADGLALGRRLMTGRWIMCEGGTPPVALTDAMDLDPDGSFSLTKDATGAFVRDRPIALVPMWSLRYASFEFAPPAGDHVLVWFEEAPLRMFVSSPKDPHVAVAVYTAP